MEARRRHHEPKLDKLLLLASCEHVGGVDGVVVGGDSDARLCQEHLTGGRQADAASVTLQQFDAEVGLEVGNRLRQRGLVTYSFSAARVICPSSATVTK